MWRTGVWVALGVLCFGCSAGNDDSSSPSGQGGSAGFGGGGGGSSGDGTGGGATGLTTSPKLDLLLVVDNSLGMTDLQKVLSNSVPKLLQPLTASGSGVIDLHVGVITTSLGSFGTTTCDNPSATPPRPEETNDQAHLLGTRPRAASAGVPEGFLTWTVGADSTSLVEKVQHLVEAADEFGCGYEQTLESAYRFLVDPKPYLTSTIAACPGDSTKQCATQTGVDLELLAERGRFLRNDSALAVVFLSNENDCSTRAGATEFVAMKAETLLPGGSAACETDPNDPCCYQCGSTPPTGCTADPTCKPALDTAADKANLRCFEQKRRFGEDYLYPVARYANAFTQPMLCTSRADLDTSACPDADGVGGPDVVPNPLFAAGASGRSASLVHVVSIVGVPWQTLSTGGKSGPIHYPTGAELAAKFPLVYGDPTAHPPVRPSDPLMIESIEPRKGVTPGTGENLAPPSSGYLANSVNGHEYTVTNLDDLQYACVSPLPAPKDCTQLRTLDPRPLCECDTTNPAYADNPSCQNPDGTYGNSMLFAKAYPGLRHAGLVKALGDRAALASICARTTTDSSSPDFAYVPAMDLVLRELGVPH